MPVRTAATASCAMVSHPATSLDGSDSDHTLEPKPADVGSGMQQKHQEPGPYQKKVSLEHNVQNCGNKVPLVSSSAGQNFGSVSTHTNSAMGNITSGASVCAPPTGFKSSTGTTTQWWNPNNSGSQKIANPGASDLEPVHTRSEKTVRTSTGESADAFANLHARGKRRFQTDVTSDQQRVISAKGKIFVPRTAIRQYRLRNSGAAELSHSPQEPNQNHDGARRDLHTLRNGVYNDCEHWK